MTLFYSKSMFRLLINLQTISFSYLFFLYACYNVNDGLITIMTKIIIIIDFPNHYGLLYSCLYIVQVLVVDEAHRLKNNQSKVPISCVSVVFNVQSGYMRS